MTLESPTQVQSTVESTSNDRTRRLSTSFNRPYPFTSLSIILLSRSHQIPPRIEVAGCRGSDSPPASQFRENWRPRCGAQFRPPTIDVSPRCISVLDCCENKPYDWCMSHLRQDARTSSETFDLEPSDSPRGASEKLKLLRQTRGPWCSDEVHGR